MQPFFLLTRSAAIRAFGDLVANPEQQISKHPEDYVLYELGVFNDDSGQVEGHDTPIYISKALDFIDPNTNTKGLHPLRQPSGTNH